MSESEFEKVGRFDEFSEGVPASIELATGEHVCLVRVESEMFGMAEDCPHGASQMSDGAMVDDYVIECAMHSSQFDVRDGSAVEPPAEEPIQTYEVKVVGGDVLVRGIFG